jgi:hypothetical protein
MSNRARSYDEIQPLIKLCKAGRLFEVQDWIKSGDPINLALPPEKGRHRKTPLEVAIESGFHSLVQVLLEAGADVDYPTHSPVAHALTDLKNGLHRKTIPKPSSTRFLPWFFDPKFNRLYLFPAQAPYLQKLQCCFSPGREFVQFCCHIWSCEVYYDKNSACRNNHYLLPR